MPATSEGMTAAQRQREATAKQCAAHEAQAEARVALLALRGFGLPEGHPEPVAWIMGRIEELDAALGLLGVAEHAEEEAAAWAAWAEEGEAEAA